MADIVSQGHDLVSSSKHPPRAATASTKNVMKTFEYDDDDDGDDVISAMLKTEDQESI